MLDVALYSCQQLIINILLITVSHCCVAGFLKTGAKGSAQGNFGLMDLVAGLHWLRENLPAFGGDPDRITLMGHGTGAALANFIAVSPVAKGENDIQINICTLKHILFAYQVQCRMAFNCNNLINPIYSVTHGRSHKQIWLQLILFIFYHY